MRLKQPYFTPKVQLSIQQLLDCNSANYGCDGGDYTQAYPYMNQFGLMLESAYPFTGKQQKTCNYKASSVVAYLTSWYQLNDEIDTMDWVAKHGPAYANIDATPLQLYKSGVIPYSKCGANSSPDHAVQIVGINTDIKNNGYGISYWIVSLIYLI